MLSIKLQLQERADRAKLAAQEATVRVLPGRLSGLSDLHSKSIVYGGFVWVRGTLNGPKRRFLVGAEGAAGPCQA
jgi:hypothetical protein